MGKKRSYLNALTEKDYRLFWYH